MVQIEIVVEPSLELHSHLFSTCFYCFAPVSIAITALGADFTRLESFGKVDAFAENLVGLMHF